MKNKNRKKRSVNNFVFVEKKGYDFVKRIFDLVASALMLVALSPLLLIVALLVMTDGGPAIYSQIRVGKNGKEFKMFKFRTMIVDQFDSNGNEIMSENRITKVGKWLRKLSLDELPQLLNILNGTMSIIGPRPMLDYQAPRCIGEENLRFEMRPGLTGYAQVNGRNAISWDERFNLDVEYVDNYNIWIDIKILFMTVSKVLRRDGISQDGHATMEKFNGNN